MPAHSPNSRMSNPSLHRILYFIAITSYNQHGFLPRIINMPLNLFAHKRVNQRHWYRFFSGNEMTLAALYKSVRHKAANGITVILFTTLFLSISNCSFLATPATEKLAANLSTAILQQNDPETAKYGAPAYLIMVDGLIIGDPTNENLLLSGAKLYALYAGAFIDGARRRGTDYSRCVHGIDQLSYRCRNPR